MTPAAGRYLVWGMGRHTSDDGLRLVVNGVTTAVMAAPAGSLVKLEKMIVEVNGSQPIATALNVATGLGSASFTLFYQRQCDHISEHCC